MDIKDNICALVNPKSHLRTEIRRRDLLPLAVIILGCNSRKGYSFDRMSYCSGRVIKHYFREITYLLKKNPE